MGGGAQPGPEAAGGARSGRGRPPVQPNGFGLPLTDPRGSFVGRGRTVDGPGFRRATPGERPRSLPGEALGPDRQVRKLRRHVVGLVRVRGQHRQVVDRGEEPEVWQRAMRVGRQPESGFVGPNERAAQVFGQVMHRHREVERPAPEPEPLEVDHAGLPWGAGVDDVAVVDVRVDEADLRGVPPEPLQDARAAS